METKIESTPTIIRGTSSEIIGVEIPISEEVKANLVAQNLPPSLFLFISKNKEYPPFYRHAWGSAFVSTNAQGTDRFPVESLTFQIQMPSPGGTETDRKSAQGVAEVVADTKYYGAGAFGDFESRWGATAYHPAYGTWSHESTW